MSLDALDYRSSALLVIDLQNAFLHAEGTLGVSGVDTGRLSKIVEPVGALVWRFQEAGLPVIWTRQEHLKADAGRARKRLASHTSRRKQISALRGSWDQDIVDELKPLLDHELSHVILKHRFGAFFETRLEMLLKMLGTQSLFVAGATTNACIETSIREAYLLDYDVVAVGDCISGVNERWEETAKEVWRQYFCESADSAEVGEWLDGQIRDRKSAG